MKRITNIASFGLVALLIFAGANLGLGDYVHTGPNTWVRCGWTGWLDLHLDHDRWCIEQISFGRLGIEICIALILTWLLSLVLNRTHQKGRVNCDDTPDQTPGGCGGAVKA